MSVVNNCANLLPLAIHGRYACIARKELNTLQTNSKAHCISRVLSQDLPLRLLLLLQERTQGEMSSSVCCVHSLIMRSFKDCMICAHEQTRLTLFSMSTHLQKKAPKKQKSKKGSKKGEDDDTDMEEVGFCHLFPCATDLK